MTAVQEQEAKKQKLEQQEEPVEEQQQEEEEEGYTEQDLKLGHELIAAVIANDLVRNNSCFFFFMFSTKIKHFVGKSKISFRPRRRSLF